MAGMRRDLLEEALLFHEQFLAERPDDPRQRRLVARALQQTASIHSLLARYGEARELFEEQRALLEELLAVEDDPALQLELGHSLLDCAKVAKFQDDLGAAIALAQRAGEVLEPLAQQHADLEGVQGLLGIARLELGDSLGRAGDEGGAMEALEAASAGLREALARAPSSELRESLALGLHLRATSGWGVLVDRPPATEELGPRRAVGRRQRASRWRRP
jgi:tetratricopeptide (TPR) repeat protein